MGDEYLPQLTVVEGAEPYAGAYAENLAVDAVGEHHRSTDVVVAGPTAQVWASSDVERALVATRLVPVGPVGVLVLTAVNQIPAAVADRLLVASESGSGGWRIVVTTTALSGLPVTLRSRVGRVVTLESGAAPALPGDVAAAVASVPAPGADPLPAALATMDEITRVTNQYPPNERPRLRRLAVLACCNRWEAELLAAVGRGACPKQCAEALECIDTARSLLRLNGDPTLALVSVTTTAAAVASARSSRGR